MGSLFVFIVMFIMITFLLFKGFKRWDELGDWSEANPGLVVLIGVGAGLFFALMAHLILVRTGIAKRHGEGGHQSVTKKDATSSSDGDIESNGVEMDKVQIKSSSNIDPPNDVEQTNTVSPTADDEAGAKSNDIESSIQQKKKEEKMETQNNKFMAMGNKFKSGLEVDIFDDLTKEESDLEKYSTKFDPKTERLFEWLSVLAATFGIFAHGSNDIANAIAPFTSIISLSQQNAGDVIQSANEVPLYVLFIGSLFMSIGCITYGYNVIKTLGVELAKMSPSRGYFTQVGAATVIIFASNYGFPASTTHAQVGSTIAIGLIEKIYNKDLKWNQVFNWKLLLQVFFGWIATILIAGSTSALIYSVLAYSPCA